MAKFRVASNNIFPRLESQIYLQRWTNGTDIIQQLPESLL